MLEELELVRNFGGLVVALVFMFIFSKYVTGLAFDQVKISNERMFKFMDDTFKENTKAMGELVLSMKQHTQSKDAAIRELAAHRRHEAEVLLEPNNHYQRD